MPGFVWTIVGALLAALVIGLGFQSAFLGVIALGLVAVTIEVIQRLLTRRRAARLVKWELESILIRIERLRDLDPTLTGDYLLPTTEWTKQRAVLVRSRSFDTIVSAYREVDRVNDQWSWRKDIAKGGLIAANIQKDGLDTLEAATKSAIQASRRLVP
jgi:hypothetical protein